MGDSLKPKGLSRNQAQRDVSPETRRVRPDTRREQRYLTRFCGWSQGGELELVA
jgi:hypothetical protein